ncbi:type II secretion system protein GspL [Shimia haliotis]|uniref:Type II secretion system protein L n=1 Tax=Shimia haliotis TaxID=1280847 RepID=A0A1I4EKR0_9RHOB|nr:type II secretion system protein GspL [Shimia haliotis]SFL05127.1 type II secretion system protein L [Shimia haliotis]
MTQGMMMKQTGNKMTTGPDGVALVPGELIPVLPVDLPSSLRGSTREQVARRQLADSAGLDTNTAEIRPFFLGGADSSWSHALVADRDQIAQWIASAPPNCTVLPDYLALPTTEGVWTLQADPDADRVLVRLGPQDGFAADAQLTQLMLERDLSEGLPPKSVLWIGPKIESIKALFEGSDISTTETAAEVGAKVFGHGERALDLRRDPFATRARLRRSVLPWRWPALVAMIATGLWAASLMISVEALETERRAVQLQTMNTVRTQFVPAGPVLDIRAQVTRALSDARKAALTSDEGLPPLALFGESVDLITGPGITPERAEYRDEDGLRLLLEVSDFATGEALVTALQGAGLTVDVLRSEAVSDRAGVTLELRLEGGA